MLQAGKIKTDQEVMDSMDDLEMFKRPHLWPRTVLLPLKRYNQSKPGGFPEFGFLTIVSQSAVIKANLYEVNYKNTDLSTLPQEDYGSPEGVYDAGWRVD